MKKILISILAVLLIALTGCTQDAPKTGEAIPVAPKLYPAAVPTGEGIQWGYVDEKGKLVIAAKFQEARFFQKEGLAVVKENGLYGLVDSHGNYRLRPEYVAVSGFVGGHCVVEKEGPWYELIGQNGAVLYESSQGIVPTADGGAVIKDYEQERILYGYIQKDGKVVIEPQYAYATPFSGERAAVKLQNGNGAIIDTKGTVLQEFPCDDIQGISEKYFGFKISGKERWNYKDVEGKTLLKTGFTSVEPFVGGTAIVGSKVGSSMRYGVINENGQYLLRAKFGKIVKLSNGYYGIARGIKTTDGDEVLPMAVFSPEGRRLTDYQYYSLNGVGVDRIAASDGKQTFVLDGTGNPVAGFSALEGYGSGKLVDGLIQLSFERRVVYLQSDGKPLWKSPEGYDLNGGLKIKQVREVLEDGSILYVPELSGLSDTTVSTAINQNIRQFFVQPSVQPQSGEGFMAPKVVDGVVTVNKQILLVQQFGTSSGIKVRHFNLKTGEAYNLVSLFGANTGWQEGLALQVKAQMEQDNKKHPGMWKLESVGAFSADSPFRATRLGLEMVDGTGSWKGANGEIQTPDHVLLPYGGVLQWISTESPFWNAYEKQDM